MTLRAAPEPADPDPAARTQTRRSARARRLVQRRRLVQTLLAAALLPAGAAGAPAAHAQSGRPADAIEILRASLEPTADGDAWALSADLTLDLSNRLAEAVNRGVPLYFVAEFVLVRPRWWWFDERTVEASQTWRLAYHALTRQYRLSLNGLQQRFDNLDDALAALARVRGWRVIDRDRARDGTFEASVRMRLDVSQLPKPFQLSAIIERDWNLQSEWKRFPFNPETAKSAQ